MAPARPRVAPVTGSGSGIGATTVHAMARSGITFLIHALQNEAGCQRVAAMARGAGAEAEIVFGDLAEPELGTALVRRTIDCVGSLDVLVANAGFPSRAGSG